VRQHRPLAQKLGTVAREHDLEIGHFGKRTRGVRQGALEGFGRAFGLGGHAYGLPAEDGEDKERRAIWRVEMSEASLASQTRKRVMLKWAIILAVVALIAGALGFTGVAGAAAGIAKILFVVFLIGVVLMLVLGATVFKSVAK
jgi:uncharacterized membrane protein YtjA (UPF0391 family)